MTFVDQPMMTDASDACVWRGRVSGATILNEGSAGAAYNLISSGGVTVDLTPAPLFPAIVSNTQNYRTGNLAQFSVAAGLTLSAWIRASTLGGLDRILLKQNQVGWTSPQYDTIIFLQSALTITGGTTTTGGFVSAVGPNAMVAGEWIHVGLVVAAGGSSCNFYVRGVLVGTVPRTAILGSNSGPWYLGGRAGTVGDNFQGQIWDARIATVERPLSWFQESYARGQRFVGSLAS
jgi:hypothetical protein